MYNYIMKLMCKIYEHDYKDCDVTQIKDNNGNIYLTLYCKRCGHELR